MNKLIFIVSVTLLSGSTTVLAQSQEEAEFAVETRQSVLHLVRWNFGPLAGMAREKVPYDAEVAKVRAQRLHDLLLMLPDAFKMDTREFDVETEALDAVWADMDGFNNRFETAMEAAEALVAGSGDPEQLPALVGAMGTACGGCHDDYRVDD